MGCGKQEWFVARSHCRLCNPTCFEAAAYTSSGFRPRSPTELGKGSRRLRSRREGRQNARPGARAFVERRALVLLVGRMNLVVVVGEADEQAVHGEFALERTDDRNRPAAADQRRGLAPFGLERASGEAQSLILGRHRNGGAAGV